MPNEDEVRALTKELRGQGIDVEVYTGGEGTSSYQLTEASADALARVVLEWYKKRRQAYIDRLTNRAIGQSYREEE